MYGNGHLNILLTRAIRVLLVVALAATMVATPQRGAVTATVRAVTAMASGLE